MAKAVMVSWPSDNKSIILIGKVLDDDACAHASSLTSYFIIH